VGSRIRNAEERLRRLQDDPVDRPPAPLRFQARFDGGQATGVLAQLEEVAVGDRLQVDDLTIRGGQRLLIHGPNGAGKTTLLRVLAGDLEPDQGHVKRHARVGYLAQEVPPFRPEHTLLDAFAEGQLGDRDSLAERLMQLGLFHADTLWVRVARLSIGQRRRLALARLLVGQHDLLLLDEPTNHLSPALIEELETALADYEGALVIVSHDRLLRQRFKGAQVEMRAGQLVA
jgi:macrolide transport system ATP-binding/permease protein